MRHPLKNKDGYTALGIALGLVQEGNYEEVIKCLRAHATDTGTQRSGFFQYCSAKTSSEPRQSARLAARNATVSLPRKYQASEGGARPLS